MKATWRNWSYEIGGFISKFATSTFRILKCCSSKFTVTICSRERSSIFPRAEVPKNRFGEVCALFDWVRRNVRYTRDIFRVELLHSARRMLELQAGDCDDMTILLGAMLMATGHPVRLVLAGFRPNKPHVYSHIYPEVNVRGRWLPVDATVERPIGWAPPALWKRVCEIEKEGIKCSSKTR